jgi:hypothetical protein
MKFTVLGMVLSVLMLVGIGVYLYSDSKSAPPETSMLSKEEALSVILTKYPELATYATTDLPPSSIVTKESPGGWYVGFIRKGSGVPGILDATCYFVDSERTITHTGSYEREGMEIAEDVILETCTPVPVTQVPVISVTDDGLSFGEVGVFGDISIRPLSLEEDSRCPIDVTCIQAGTIRILIEVTKDGRSANSIVKLGQAFTTENVRILLTEVTPETRSTVSIEEGAYRFHFTVTSQSTPPPPNPTGACHRGGCSGQICSDQPDMVSTCEYREEYSCYQTATCERQVDGQCGWTETPTLRACLMEATQ